VVRVPIRGRWRLSKKCLGIDDECPEVAQLLAQDHDEFEISAECCLPRILCLSILALLLREKTQLSDPLFVKVTEEPLLRSLAVLAAESVSSHIIKGPAPGCRTGYDQRPGRASIHVFFALALMAEYDVRGCNEVLLRFLKELGSLLRYLLLHCLAERHRFAGLECHGSFLRTSEVRCEDMHECHLGVLLGVFRCRVGDAEYDLWHLRIRSEADM
jgi:hypothetical protein